MVFTITNRRHLYGVYHHKKAPLWCLPSQPITILLEGTSMVFTMLEGTSMVFTIITYYNPVRRHLYGVYHHNLLQSC